MVGLIGKVSLTLNWSVVPVTVSLSALLFSLFCLYKCCHSWQSTHRFSLSVLILSVHLAIVCILTLETCYVYLSLLSIKGTCSKGQVRPLGWLL